MGSIGGLHHEAVCNKLRTDAVFCLHNLSSIERILTYMQNAFQQAPSSVYPSPHPSVYSICKRNRRRIGCEIMAKERHCDAIEKTSCDKWAGPVHFLVSLWGLHLAGRDGNAAVGPAIGESVSNEA